MNGFTKRALAPVALLLVILLALTAAGAEAEVYYYDYLYLSTTAAGTTEDGLAYAPGDIIGTTGVAAPWFTYFDASEHGLGAHNINAFDFDATEEAWVTSTMLDSPIYMSFVQNRIRVPGVASPVLAHDVVKFQPTTTTTTGGSFEMYFDGSDVGLSTTAEQIDSLTVWTPEDFGSTDVSVPDDCTAGLLFISTVGLYRVPAADGSSLVGRGSDILVFCATNLGLDTAGFWFKGFDGVAAGFQPLGALRNVSVHGFEAVAPTSVGGWEMEFSFSTTAPFTIGAFAGQPNVVYLYETGTGIEGTFRDLNYDDPMLNGSADGLMLTIYESICTSDC